MDNRCKTCKYWHRIDVFEGECENDKNSPGFCGEDWVVIGLCGPEYGCVHHREKRDGRRQ